MRRKTSIWPKHSAREFSLLTITKQSRDPRCCVPCGDLFCFAFWWSPLWYQDSATRETEVALLYVVADEIVLVLRRDTRATARTSQLNWEEKYASVMPSANPPGTVVPTLNAWKKNVNLKVSGMYFHDHLRLRCVTIFKTFLVLLTFLLLNPSKCDKLYLKSFQILLWLAENDSALVNSKLFNWARDSFLKITWSVATSDLSSWSLLIDLIYNNHRYAEFARVLNIF